MKKLIGIGLVLLAVGGAVGWYFFQKPVGSLNSETAAFELEAATLLGDYESDETAANSKYLGKIVTVKGTVAAVETKSDGLKSVTLEAGSVMAGVICELDGSTSKQEFKAGQTVSFKGECTGMLMDVVVTRCVLLE
jgi:hypothetical protein